jgi:hydroxymethylpyrimidine/phosphomethylpyrimidine kinase
MRPIALSIAGFDPSGGAGLLADIKTFEAHDVQGLGVCSALTFQNDVEFDDIKWTPVEEIVQQIEVLQRRFELKFVKIGLIESLEVLQTIIKTVRKEIPNATIIWDPVLKASAGFVFHESVDKKVLENAVTQLQLVTPNYEEIAAIYPEMDADAAATHLAQFGPVLLKGGHNYSTSDVTDVLLANNRSERFVSEKLEGFDKHGTGCILSAAILSNLAKENALEVACRKAKAYVWDYMKSTEHQLGYHLS